MALRTDYKDDILDTSVNEKRKYNLITNSDGTVSFEDVTEYLQVGDSFGSADANAITKKLTDNVLDTMEEVKANTRENQLAGALAVKELGVNVNKSLFFRGYIPADAEIKTLPCGVWRTNENSPTTYGVLVYSTIYKPFNASLEGAIMVCQQGNYKGGLYHNDMGKGCFVRAKSYHELNGTLTAGETTITLTYYSITTDSTFDFYTSIYGVSPISAPIVTDGSITLEFDAQETDMNVEVRVM